MSKRDQASVDGNRNPLRRISPQPNNERFRSQVREAIEAGELVMPEQAWWLDQYKNELIAYENHLASLIREHLRGEG